MKIIKLFIFILSFQTQILFAQKQNEKEIKLGIYSGGICFDNGICGNWLLSSDSTFLFIKFESDYLKSIGYGKWSIERGDIINFKFEQEKLAPILLPVQYEYTSKTIAPFDSIYISGQLIDPAGKGIGYASIIYNSSVFLSDKNGFFSECFPISKMAKNELIIIKKIDTTLTTQMQLAPNSNVHKIKIVLPKEDSATCLSVQYAYPSLLNQSSIKMHLNNGYNNPKKNINGLSFITNDKTYLITKLRMAQQKQNCLKHNISNILEIINYGL